MVMKGWLDLILIDFNVATEYTDFPYKFRFEQFLQINKFSTTVGHI